MSDLRELYQEVILDHSKSPRNFHALDDATCSAEGYNPLCGDHLVLYLKVEGDVIVDAGFTGAGCAISSASASMMTAALKGRTRLEAEQLFERFHLLVTGAPDETPAEDPALGKLAVFSGVREFPMRVKCASLAWHTMKSALHGDQAAAVSTE